MSTLISFEAEHQSGYEYKMTTKRQGESDLVENYTFTVNGSGNIESYETTSGGKKVATNHRLGNCPPPPLPGGSTESQDAGSHPVYIEYFKIDNGSGDIYDCSINFASSNNFQITDSEYTTIEIGENGDEFKCIVVYYNESANGLNSLSFQDVDCNQDGAGVPIILVEGESISEPYIGTKHGWIFVEN